MKGEINSLDAIWKTTTSASLNLPDGYLPDLQLRNPEIRNTKPPLCQERSRLQPQRVHQQDSQSECPGSLNKDTAVSSHLCASWLEYSLRNKECESRS